MEWIALLLILLGILLYLGIPVAIALALSASALLVCLDIPLVVAVQRMASGLNIFALMAIPLFIFAGELMNQAGIARRLIRLAEGALGRAPGGLGQVTIFASMLFGGYIRFCGCQRFGHGLCSGAGDCPSSDKLRHAERLAY